MVVGDHRLAGVDQSGDQLGHVDLGARLHHPAHPGLDDIDAHADSVVVARLLAVAGDQAGGVGLQDARADDGRDDVRRHGNGGLALAVGPDNGGVVDVADYVGVHDQHGLAELRQQRYGPRGADGGVLADVGDAAVEARAVAEIGLDQGGEVIDRQGDVADAELLQGADDVFENRLVAYRHERLGQCCGVGIEPLATPPGHDQCA